jgi:threonyl-tRNA synthetase
LVVGKREAEERTVSIRRLGSQAQTVASLDATIEELASEATPPDLRRTGNTVAATASKAA